MLVDELDDIVDEADEETPEELEEEVELVFEDHTKYTSEQLSGFADALLKDDSNRELCRKCRDELGPNSLPYGKETGNIEAKAQYDNKGHPVLDIDEEQLYVEFPEFECEQGHRWFKGEGQRRDIRGRNPILFESHLYNRKRREIMVESGIPDPAFTLDRFGKPTQGIYNRSHPAGRKINTKAQREKNGASYYRISTFLPIIYAIIHVWHIHW
jgi:hypothetical protein